MKNRTSLIFLALFCLVTSVYLFFKPKEIELPIKDISDVVNSKLVGNKTGVYKSNTKQFLTNNLTKIWGPMTFISGRLVNSKSCNSPTPANLKITFTELVSTLSKSEIKVVINGEEDRDNRQRIMKLRPYKKNGNSKEYYKWCGQKNKKRWKGDSYYFKDWLGFKKNVWNRITCDIMLPPFSKYEKEEVPLEVYFIVDGVVLYKLEKIIRYLDEGEAFTYIEKRNFHSVGYCGPPDYFEDETLHAIKKAGYYKVERSMETVISKEDNRYKIVTNFPSGNLINDMDTLCKIPVPAFPENIEYVDLSFDLKEGTYNHFSENIRFIVRDQALGKFVGYTYERRPIGYQKTISFQGCDIQEIDNQCYKIPVGIYFNFVDYPPDITNNYVL